MTTREHEIDCPGCHRRVVPYDQRRHFWPMMVAFWAFSLLFGIGASFSVGWGVVMLLAWLALACAVGLSARQNATLSCPRCGTDILGGAGPRRPAEVV